MHVRTTRFGELEIADDRVIFFPKGLLGFAEHKRYCLLEPAEDACFFWLQSLEDPSLAFVVTDPSFFVGEYSVPIRDDQMVELKLPRLEDAQVFVIVNKIDQSLTGNLQGPLVINAQNRIGTQTVLNDKKWTTRQPLLRLSAEVALAKSA